jgi:hypothetical protein
VSDREMRLAAAAPSQRRHPGRHRRARSTPARKANRALREHRRGAPAARGIA